MSRKVKVETRKVSAEAKLYHAEFRGVAQQAIAVVQAAMQTAENMIAKHMATIDTLDLTDGWRLNLDKMEWVKMPIPQPEE